MKQLLLLLTAALVSCAEQTSIQREIVPVGPAEPGHIAFNYGYDKQYNLTARTFYEPYCSGRLSIQADVDPSEIIDGGVLSFDLPAMAQIRKYTTESGISIQTTRKSPEHPLSIVEWVNSGEGFLQIDQIDYDLGLISGTFEATFAENDMQGDQIFYRNGSFKNLPLKITPPYDSSVLASINGQPWIPYQVGLQRLADSIHVYGTFCAHSGGHQIDIRLTNPHVGADQALGADIRCQVIQDSLLPNGTFLKRIYSSDNIPNAGSVTIDEYGYIDEIGTSKKIMVGNFNCIVRTKNGEELKIENGRWNIRK